MQYNVIDVLNTYGVKYTKSSTNDEYIVLCPFHDDHTPSGHIKENGKYTCWVCKTHTNLLLFVAKRNDKSIKQIYFEVSKFSGGSKNYLTHPPRDIEEWHVNLLKHQDNGSQFYIEALQHRCVDEELIRHYRLGYFIYGDQTCAIRIPIRNESGEVIAIKDYRPGCTDNRKYGWPQLPVNKQKFNPNETRKLRDCYLFPIEQLIYDSIVVCGGEIKAIAAANVLNPFNIGAISSTGSETIPLTDFQASQFAGKKVYVCQDIDIAGQDSAEVYCEILKNHAEEVYRIDLPLDSKEYPHGDINDFLRIRGNLLNLIQSCPLWKSKEEIELNVVETPLEVDLVKAVSASMVKKRISVKVTVSSKDIKPYGIPKDIELKCTRDHTYCTVCKIYRRHKNKEVKLTLQSERIELIEMIGQELKKQEAILKRAFGIPIKCSTVTFNPTVHYNIEDIRVSQPLDIVSRNSECSMQTAYCIGEEKLELNENYEMIGRMYPHPENQQAALLISNYTATRDVLSTYKAKDLERLKIFSPVEWTLESLKAKLDEVYADLEANVTRIFFRRNLHLAIDLAYHSPLFLSFDNKINLKGWVEILIVGDSSQGKSETVKNLVEHYKLGEIVVCKNATRAGLLGGTQQFGKRYFATWGKIPIHDRRLIILEELKGASHAVISSLTDMRSSGIAELTMIEKRRTNARTRLIGISNPVDDRPISSYNYGIDAIKQLIGAPEDIRRFDLCLVLDRNEIDSEKLQYYRPEISHVYTSDLCHELILFAWTVPNIEFENEKFILEETAKLCKEYTDEIPIVDRGSMREKLARLSAALAARTFSIKNEHTIFVRNVHVQYIIDFLKEQYGSSSFGYKAYSRTVFKAETLTDKVIVRMRLLKDVPFPKEFILALITTDEIDVQFIQDNLGWTAQDARNLLSFLNRQHAIRRFKDIYRKTIGFTTLLKELEDSIGEDGRPSYVPEEF